MVTGASGLIGSAITARLISAGHDVFGLARNVKEENPRLQTGRGFSRFFVHRLTP
jgi:nucleoside-diphosphate-sugar epimerase